MRGRFSRAHKQKLNGLFSINTNGAIQTGILSLKDYTPSGDLGNPDYWTWASRTRDYLNSSGNDRNVIIYAWCGQVNSAAESIINDAYLVQMAALERDYPNVTFVYMTGYLEGTGLLVAAGPAGRTGWCHKTMTRFNPNWRIC